MGLSSPSRPASSRFSRAGRRAADRHDIGDHGDRRAIPVTPLGRWLGFALLPRLYWFLLAGTLLAYMRLTQGVTTWLISMYVDRETGMAFARHHAHAAAMGGDSRAPNAEV